MEQQPLPTGLVEHLVLPVLTRPHFSRARWAWFFWMRWFPNQGNGPAHPGTPCDAGVERLRGAPHTGYGGVGSRGT